MDGNKAIYPMIKDSTPSADSIKDPHWLDLMPIGALGNYVISINYNKQKIGIA